MHWTYKGKVVTEISDMPEEAIGFIYKITNHKTGQFYIGKKSLYNHRTLPPLKGYKRKRKVIKESNWKGYKSSNRLVQKWIDDFPDKIQFEILKFCKTKKGLTYYELKEQFEHQCLENELSMNDNYLGKFFRKDLE